MLKSVGESYKHNIIAFVFGPLLKIIEAIFDLLIPLFMKAVIDLSKYGDVSLMPDNNIVSKNLALFIRSFGFYLTENKTLNDALITLIIILGMGIVGFMITMITQYIASFTAMKVGTEVRNSLIEKILSLSKQDTNIIGKSKLHNVVNNDTYSIQQGALLFIRLIVRIPVILIGSLIISFLLDWRIGLVFTAIVPIVLLITFFVMRRSSKKFVCIQNDLDEIGEKTNDVIEGQKIIRGYNKQDFENKSFSNYVSKYKNDSVTVGKLNAFINPLTYAITSIAIIVISLIAGNSIISSISGEGVSIATTVVAEIAFLSQISFTLTQFANTFFVLTKAKVSEKRIDEVLKLNVYKDKQIINLESTNDIVSFNNVSLKYIEKGNYVLKDISFAIKKGESLGIIGGTGSGKSSIISLIERFIIPYGGTLLFEGVNIKDIDVKTLRSKISYVGQKASFLKGSIKDNILVGNPSLTDDEIVSVLKDAKAYEFVSKYKDGINHVIEEDGKNLSGGQRQRLNIARALAKQADLYIFDDCFSALDFVTDKKVRESIIKKYPNSSKIFISQRVGTILKCNSILVLEGGRIINQGNHETLLKVSPLYSDLYMSQRQGNLK